MWLLLDLSAWTTSLFPLNCVFVLHLFTIIHFLCFEASAVWPSLVKSSVFFTLSVAPDTINNHVKTCREEQKSLHFFAPEYGGKILPVLSFVSDAAVLCGGCFCDTDRLLSAFSGCQCYHSRGYLFLWNVRLRGERKYLVLL